MLNKQAPSNRVMQNLLQAKNTQSVKNLRQMPQSSQQRRFKALSQFEHPEGAAGGKLLLTQSHPW